jgi:glycosyltransferase involved in cell wall biosynthesis
VPRLSLIVIARNEEAAIGRCLGSAAFADEIVVVDNDSTDKTVEIARSFRAKVIKASDWPGFGPQKNRALKAATGDWVLSLDADEWVGPALSAAIKRVMADLDAADGYEMPRRSRFRGAIVHHGGWWPDHVLRLFRRERGRFSDDPVHERLIVDGRVERLRAPIDHDAIADAADAREKASRYAEVAATELARKGVRSNWLKALGHAAWAFINTYFVRAGFLDGRAGFGVALYNTRYTWQKWWRLASTR